MTPGPSECVETHLPLSPQAGAEAAPWRPWAMNGEFWSDISAGRFVNPGHDIECSWFLMEEAKYRGRPGAAGGGRWRSSDMAIEAGLGPGVRRPALLHRLPRGFPPEAYEHDMKLWWPHNEILIASLMIYRDSGRREVPATGSCKTAGLLQAATSRTRSTASGTAICAGTASPPMPACKGCTFKGPFHVPRSLIMADQLIGQILEQN